MKPIMGVASRVKAAGWYPGTDILPSRVVGGTGLEPVTSCV